MTIQVKDALGTTQTVNTLNDLASTVATAANQSTANSSLSTIGTNTGNASTVLGAKTDAAATNTDATSISMMQVFKQISKTLQAAAAAAATAWFSKITDGTNTATVKAASTLPVATDTALVVTVRDANSNGQAIMTGSTPVVIASDQSAIPAKGDVASGSSDSGNPLKVGGQARTTNPTAVTDGQRANAIFDKLGKQITVGAIRELKAVQKTTITSSTSETTILTAGAAGVFVDPYSIMLSNTSATQCNVTIKDATGGTTRMIICVPPGETRGFTVPVDSAVPQATAANNWTATCSAGVASLEVTVLYVKNT